MLTPANNPRGLHGPRCCDSGDYAREHFECPLCELVTSQSGVAFKTFQPLPLPAAMTSFLCALSWRVFQVNSHLFQNGAKRDKDWQNLPPSQHPYAQCSLDTAYARKDLSGWFAESACLQVHLSHSRSLPFGGKRLQKRPNQWRLT